MTTPDEQQVRDRLDRLVRGVPFPDAPPFDRIPEAARRLQARRRAGAAAAALLAVGVLAATFWLLGPLGGTKPARIISSPTVSPRRFTNVNQIVAAIQRDLGQCTDAEIGLFGPAALMTGHAHCTIHQWGTVIWTFDPSNPPTFRPPSGYTWIRGPNWVVQIPNEREAGIVQGVVGGTLIAPRGQLDVCPVLFGVGYPVPGHQAASDWCAALQGLGPPLDLWVYVGGGVDLEEIIRFGQPPLPVSSDSSVLRLTDHGRYPTLGDFQAERPGTAQLIMQNPPPGLCAWHGSRPCVVATVHVLARSRG